MGINRASIKIGIVLIATAGIAISLTGHAANDDDTKANNKKEYSYDEKLRRLDTYEKLYSAEIIDYCIDLHGLVSNKLPYCMRMQGRLKNEMLAMAQQQLGDRKQAESVYDDCLAYYPGTGVAKAATCVGIRLMLDLKIGNEPVEKAIFQNCISKWRKHGTKAVSNCCLHAGNYYLRYGELRD